MKVVSSGTELQSIGMQIIDDATRNNFHPLQVTVFLVEMYQESCRKVPSIPWKFYVVYDEQLWAIVCEGNATEVKYVYVQAHARRNKWFTKFINSLPKHKQIIVCSKEKAMVRALIALGFTLHGKSKDKKELRFERQPAQKSCDV